MSVKKTVLNVFTQISNEKEATKPDLCVRLWNHLNHLRPDDLPEEDSENVITHDVEYTLRRLIQGLGSARAFIRKSYFATLVSMFSNWSFSHSQITLSYVKSLIDKHLSKFESRGEEGEVLTGRILAYGVTFRSKVFLNADIELQHEILEEILTKSKERSYLPPLAYSIVIDFIKNIDEDIFKKVVWPILNKHILVDWSHQSFETLYCLLEIQNIYPMVLKKKLILPILGTSSVLHSDTIENVQSMLLNISWEPSLKHPVYDSVSSYLCRNSENSDLSIKYWECVENALKSSPPRLTQLAVLKIFCSMVKSIDLNQIPSLFTSHFADYVINASRWSDNKKDILSLTAQETLQFLISHVVQNEDDAMPSVLYKILCNILIDSGHLLVDKITGVKVVTPCVSKLDAKHVKLLAKKCENVVFLQPNEKEKRTSHRWNYKERCYAAQLLARLISHPESQDMDWKIKHLKLMMKHALFSSAQDNVQMSNELAAVLKNSFLTALSHQLSHLENHRMVLISLVFYIDNILSNEEYELRNSLSDEVLLCWKNTMQKIQKINLKISKTGKQKTVMYVFHTLFLQMALHLFVDPTVAKDILSELDRCYKKEKSQFETGKLLKNELAADSDSEPQWIEIVVELLLSLLSRDTYSLRQLISRIFPHLCPYLTAQATFQILEIFDPNSNNNILTNENESEDESSDADGDEKQYEGKAAMEVDELDEESDSEVEENDDVEESAIEKTRQVVRDALGVAGSVTDTESVDLDDIDEEVGRKLDMALSEAFRTAKKPSNSGKNKKQSPSEKALTNFRIRVLDLVDIYLDNNPSFSLVLDTIPALFALLEFCIKDNHQKPLENRLRSTIKKVGGLKKCCGLENVDEEILTNVLKTLMDKGVRTTSVFLNLCHEMSECCTFLLRIGIQICGNEDNSSSSEILDIFTASVDNFFLKRDCLLPITLFENILMKTNWINNTKLCHRILSFAFNSSVRGFRRNQGLILLNCFYKNNRSLAALKENNDAYFIELEDEILENAKQVLIQLKDRNDQKFKPSFVSELFILLLSVKINKFSAGSSKWRELADVLQIFSKNETSLPNITRKYMVRLCSLLQIESQNKQSTSRKRRRLNSEENMVAQKNGFIVRSSQNDDSDEEVSPTSVNNDSENICSQKNVIKKKKSKRKTAEHFDSKKLRSTLANNVDVLKFSSTNFLET